MRKIMREFGVNLVFGLKNFAFKFRNFLREFSLNLAFEFINFACELGLNLVFKFKNLVKIYALNFVFKFRNFAKIFALNSLKFSEKKFALKSQNVVD